MLEQQDIENMLIELGAPVNLKGFAYMAEAIQQYQPGMFITKELYPQIAKTFQTTAARVERAIRWIIGHIFDRNDPEDIYRIFGNTPSRRNGMLTNAEFISLVKFRLEQQKNVSTHKAPVFLTS